MNENKKETRVNWIEMEFDDLPTEEEQEERMHYIKRKVFKIISDVLSVSFNMHFKEGVDYEKVKAYCC